MFFNNNIFIYGSNSFPVIRDVIGNETILINANNNVYTISTNDLKLGLYSGEQVTFTGDVFSTYVGTHDINLSLANTGVLAGTYTKFEVDSKGRILEGLALEASDIPNLSISQIDSLSDTLSYKVNSNTYINVGEGLTGGGSLLSNVSVSHAYTSNISNTSINANTIITSIDFDNFGHVLDIQTSNLPSDILRISDIDLSVQSYDANTVIDGSYVHTDNNFSNTLKNKLDNLSNVAVTGSYNDLLHTPSIPTTLSELNEDTTHRIVTDSEKSTWNNKQNSLTADVDYLTPSTANTTYELKDSTILKSGDIGVTVQGYNANTTIQGVITLSYLGFTGDTNANYYVYDDSNVLKKSDAYSNVSISNKLITQNDITSYGFLTVESDPVFTAWNKSTGISISKSQISDFPAFSNVATSGSYNDLLNTPSIPTSLSQLSDDITHRLVTDTEINTWNSKLSANTVISANTIVFNNANTSLTSNNINAAIIELYNMLTRTLEW